MTYGWPNLPRSGARLALLALPVRSPAARRRCTARSSPQRPVSCSASSRASSRRSRSSSRSSTMTSRSMPSPTMAAGTISVSCSASAASPAAPARRGDHMASGWIMLGLGTLDLPGACSPTACASPGSAAFAGGQSDRDQAPLFRRSPAMTRRSAAFLAAVDRLVFRALGPGPEYSDDPASLRKDASCPSSRPPAPTSPSNIRGRSNSGSASSRSTGCPRKCRWARIAATGRRSSTDHERNLLTQIFRFFTQADVEVQDCYHEKYGRVFKPTEIKMMLTAFSNMETVHIAAYATCSTRSACPRANIRPSSSTRR